MRIGDKVICDDRPGVFKGEQSGLTIVSFADGNKEEVAIAPQDVEGRIKPAPKPKAN